MVSIPGMALHQCELCGAHLAWLRSKSLFRSQGRRVPSGWRESSSASGGRGRWGKTCRTVRTWRHGCSCGTLLRSNNRWRNVRKREKRTSQKVSHGFKLRVSNTTLLSVSLFSKLISGCANCKKIETFSFESVEIKSVAETKLKLQWC